MPGIRLPVLTGFLVLALFGWGCRGSDDAARDGVEAPESELIRGFYHFGHEVRSFRPCGEDEELWAIDASGRLADLFGQLVESPNMEPHIFVLAEGRHVPPPAEGFGAEYAGAVVITEVVYAAHEGFRCDFDPTRFRYRAHGNEPFWLVEVTSAKMKFVRPGHPDLVWKTVGEETAGDEIILRGAGGEGPALLTIGPGPGYDSMSGAFHHRKAVCRPRTAPA